MPTQTLGKVKLTPRGAYDHAATYVPLDIVSYGGGSYCVLQNITGVTPTGDDVNYQLLAESGADGKSPQISASKTWLVWDANAGEYVDSGVSAAGAKGDNGEPGKAPIIGSNGNWYEWDDASGAYTDTGKPSRGEKGDKGNAFTFSDFTEAQLAGLKGDKGDDGKSAYQYAKDGGYTGTEAEFAAKLAQEKYPNPNAITFTGTVEGSYDGSAPLSVEIPGGGVEREWSLLGTVDCSVVSGDIEFTDLDNYTEFYVLWETPKNDSTTRSGYNLGINGHGIADSFVPVAASTGVESFGYSYARYNGLVWLPQKSEGAILKSIISMVSGNANYPYNHKLNVGAATTFKLAAPVQQYQVTSGRIKIYGR